MKKSQIKNEKFNNFNHLGFQKILPCLLYGRSKYRHSKGHEQSKDSLRGQPQCLDCGILPTVDALIATLVL